MMAQAKGTSPMPGKSPKKQGPNKALLRETNG